MTDDVRAHLDGVVRAHPEDAPVVGRVVDLAHRQAVRHDGLALIGVTENVGGVEQVDVLEAADRARPVVRPQDLRSKDGLVQAESGESLGVTADVLAALRGQEAQALVDRDLDEAPGWVVSYDVDRKDGDEDTRRDAAQQDERDTEIRSPAELRVVTAVWVTPAVGVAEQPVRSLLVVVWPLRLAEDRQGRRELRRVSDAAALVDQLERRWSTSSAGTPSLGGKDWWSYSSVVPAARRP